MPAAFKTSVSREKPTEFGRLAYAGDSGLARRSYANAQRHDPRAKLGRPKKLYRGEEGPVGSHITISHARGIEREPGISFAVQQNESAGGVRAPREKVNRFACNVHRGVRGA